MWAELAKEPDNSEGLVFVPRSLLAARPWVSQQPLWAPAPPPSRCSGRTQWPGGQCQPPEA